MTTTGIQLVAHAPTRALRLATFGSGNVDLDEGGRRAALALANQAPARWGEHWCVSSPAEAAVQTAMAWGLRPTIEAAIADCDYGDWTGHTLDEVAATNPDGVQRWLIDPDAAPHGGETLTTLIDRVGHWLHAQTTRCERITAITHAAVIRAALVNALRAPSTAFWQLDVAPLSVLHLRAGPRGWKVHLATAGPTAAVRHGT
ncbi:histidine phosphatase family protein [Micromonospora sp. DR5-3]|uniref:histidine phosphatase family protein n=1 Tax=unclassified Micromonospora TaxID=2617518 RepID=UPI0011D81C01|nr:MULTISPECIES: histidine phosphatase family protein [unclassified Micromonospora]MCW3813574.1 histidine phosphatase family protein [Micromonospora sp. DR5-3]TYC25722.1 histidine phosphatase family protein [Micromonospora sp. MP36]